MCFCEHFQPLLCSVCEVGVPRSRFPGNLGVVSETVGVSSHCELNQTFVRAMPTIPVNACGTFNRDPRAQERFWSGLVGVATRGYSSAELGE